MVYISLKSNPSLRRTFHFDRQELHAARDDLRDGHPPAAGLVDIACQALVAAAAVRGASENASALLARLQVKPEGEWSGEDVDAVLYIVDDVLA